MKTPAVIRVTVDKIANIMRETIESNPLPKNYKGTDDQNAIKERKNITNNVLTNGATYYQNSVKVSIATFYDEVPSMRTIQPIVVNVPFFQKEVMESNIELVVYARELNGIMDIPGREAVYGKIVELGFKRSKEDEDSVTGEKYLVFESSVKNAFDKLGKDPRLISDLL